MQPPDPGVLLHQAIASRLGRILQLTGDPGWPARVEAVHDVRVASRRLRAALDLAGPQLPPGLRRLRKRARILAAALGATRELDVHTGRLEGLTAALGDDGSRAALEHLLEGMALDRSRMETRTAEEISRAGLPRWPSLLEAAPTLRDGCPAPTWRSLLEPQLRETLEGAGALVLQEDAAALHRLRINTKKLRYALETLRPVLAAASDGWLARLKSLQEALGEHHDWAVLESLLWDRQARLAERRRVALSAGTLALLGRVIELRKEAFGALPAAVQGLEPHRILADLGLEALVP